MSFSDIYRLFGIVQYVQTRRRQPISLHDTRQVDRMLMTAMDVFVDGSSYEPMLTADLP